MQYSINVQNSICPKCRGLLRVLHQVPCRGRSHSLVFRCSSCATDFVVVDPGQNDREFIVQERQKPNL